MKTLILFACLLCTGELAAQRSLTVVVKNIKDAHGNVRVSLFSNEKDFLKTTLDKKLSAAQSGEMTFTFDNVPAGTYAIAVIHDENQNDKLDSNLVGIPKEGFGFSNDAMGMFGPPSFEKAKFNIPGEPIVVNLKYM